MMMTWTEPMGEMARRAALAETAAQPSEHKLLDEELDTLRREHANLKQAIFEAAQVQRKLCMPRELRWEPYEIAGEIFPVRHLSGDFFKVMKFPSRLILVLGDIAGKGLTAGIWQTHLMGLIRRAARRYADPGLAVAEVNAEMCRGDGQPPLTALFFAGIDAQTNELVYCNAGLPAPLLLRDNQTLEALEKGGPMLGAVQKAAFQSGRISLNPGDMLVAYSDGVTECRNAQDQEFEIERLATAARAVAGASASKALFSLLGTVLDFADACSPGDDVTLLVVRHNGAARNKRVDSCRKDSAPFRRVGSASPPKTPGRGGLIPNN